MRGVACRARVVRDIGEVNLKYELSILESPPKSYEFDFSRIYNALWVILEYQQIIFNL